MMKVRRGHRMTRALAALSALSLVAVACGGDDESAEEPTEEPAEEPTEAPSEEPARVAWLNASSANTFLQASRLGLDRVAQEHNVEITEFDAQFDPALQQTQLQDVVSSGQYDGIILTALIGPALIADVEAAVAAGIEVVIMNQVVGEDLNTAEPQVDGVAASVLSPAAEDGYRLGEATALACEDLDPCDVVYFFLQKGIPFDEEVRRAFDEVIGDHPNISVLAEGESGFAGPDQAYTQLQDILVSTPDFEVVVGTDQAIGGAELALNDADRDDVFLIGSGGSEAAIAGISEGRWFAGVFTAPQTEGELAMEAMVSALAGEDVGGIDATGTFPNNGIITSDNVDQFEAQWVG